MPPTAPDAAAPPRLPDHLAENLDILAIGLNPSIPAARLGFAFANPRNRFWPALNASRLVPGEITPGPEAPARLLREHAIGFTDVVRRPSRDGSALRAADFRAGAPELSAAIARYDPRIAWFLGKQAYRAFLRYALGRKRESIPWGEQPAPIGRSAVFVTPNPSPANASFSLADIASWMDALADFRARICGQDGPADPGPARAP